MKKLGLALSSGGARGFSHIGVIKSLQKKNISIDYIAGTSMGAIIAAYYALNLEVSNLEKIFKTFRKRDTLKLFDINDPRISLVKGIKAKKFLEKYFGDKTFRDTKIPLRIGATALDDGSKVIFKSGKIIDALIASGAFPGVFPVVKYKGKHLVDGGLADATPVDIVKDMGADVVIAVDLFSLEKLKKTEYSMVDTLSRTYEIIMSNLSKYSTKEYGKSIIVLKPKASKRIDTFSFHKAKHYIKQGELVTEKNIRKIKKLLK